jgi:hypothetical protein
MKRDNKIYYKLLDNPCPNPHYLDSTDSPYYLDDEASVNASEKHWAFWDVCIKGYCGYELPPYPNLSYLFLNERYFGSYVTEDELEELRDCERRYGGDPDIIQGIRIK